jgi:hypothetical protein
VEGGREEEEEEEGGREEEEEEGSPRNRKATVARNLSVSAS